MTLDELVEHIDDPMREYLAEAATTADQPSPTEWELHKQLMDTAEEEEQSDCESDPVVTMPTGGSVLTTDDGYNDEGYSPDLLTPPTIQPTQPTNDIWTAIKALLQESNPQANQRMEEMEKRSIARFENLEKKLVSVLTASNESTDGRFISVQNEIRALKGELHHDINERMDTAYVKLKGAVANTHAELLMATEDINKKMEEVKRVHEKANSVAKLAHEARNKYLLATK
jgi:hypothetical protein